MLDLPQESRWIGALEEDWIGDWKGIPCHHARLGWLYAVLRALDPWRDYALEPNWSARIVRPILLTTGRLPHLSDNGRP